MKAQRRHELQTNSLAQFLENLPLYFRFHFGKILLGVLVVVVVIVLIRHRITAGQIAREQSTAALGDVRRLLSELEVVDLTRPTADQRAADRRRFASQIDGAIDEIIAQTGDGPQDAAKRAEAMVARGDLNWIMANLPPVPGAATQPALQMPMTAEQYLADAEEAYRRVLQEHRDQKLAAQTAMFGLAGIAENRGQWDVARAQYEAILNSPDTPQAFRDLAMLRLQMLPVLQEPLFTGNLTTQPATPPAADAGAAAATTQPTTEPTTEPAAP